MKLLAASILTLSVMGTSLMAQDLPASKVPSVVTNAFTQEYANPTDVDWEKKRKNFEVDFEVDGVDHKALYSAEGQLLMTKRDLPETDLPAAINQKIAADYSGYTIDDVDQVMAEGKTYYQVELDGTLRDRKLVFTEDGQEAKGVKYWD
jgi:hypothetical protein